MLRVCVLTVPVAMRRTAAISLFDSRASSSHSTSVSRRVSDPIKFGFTRVSLGTAAVDHVDQMSSVKPSIRWSVASRLYRLQEPAAWDGHPVSDVTSVPGCPDPDLQRRGGTVGARCGGPVWPRGSRCHW